MIKTGIPAATEPQDVLSALVLEYPETIHFYEPSLTSELRSYGNRKSPRPEVQPLSPSEPVVAEIVTEPSSGSLTEKLLAAMSDKHPVTADELTLKTGIPISEIMAELTLMEIDGSVMASAGGRYIRK